MQASYFLFLIPPIIYLSAFCRFFNAKRSILSRIVFLFIIPTSVLIIDRFVPMQSQNLSLLYFLFNICFNIVMTAFLLFFSILSNNKNEKAIIGIIVYIIFLFSAIMWGYYFIYHDYLSVMALYSLLTTTPSEALGYLLSIGGKPLLTLTIILILLLLYLSFWIVKYHQELPKNKNKKIFLFTSCGFLLLLYFSYKSIFNFYLATPLIHISEIQNFKMESTRNIQEINIDKSSTSHGLYVLVIGESENSRYLSAYGYKDDTSPWLNHMKQDAHMYLFTHAYTCYPITIAAISKALTSSDQYNSIKLNKSVSLLQVAKKAGFYTIFISNQGTNAIYDTYPTIIGQQADAPIFLSKVNTKTIYDSNILPYLDAIPTDKDCLLVLHLYGSHSPRKERFPASTPSFYKDDADLNDYLRTVSFTDYVLKDIYEKIKIIPNFQGMVYFSDHGEDVENHLNHTDTNVTKDMLTIPFFIVVSDKYIQTHREKLNVLRKHTDSFFTNDLIFNTMLSIMDMTIPQYSEPENDIFNNSYNDNPERFMTLCGREKILKYFGD